ncbi:MAG: hypothetical protein LBV58_05075 [Acholeplasmatales bacterium]|jgi:hypothetical protein|nr:hypothetical protein [Acholeplasmatales bacterium]
MKKLNLILIVILMGLLVSCQKTETITEPLKATITNYSYSKTEKQLIRNRERLTSIISNYDKNSQEALAQDLEKYDSEFFKEKIIVLVNFRDSSPDTLFELKSAVIIKGVIYVTFNKRVAADPKPGSISWNYFIEIRETEKITRIDYKFINLS